MSKRSKASEENQQSLRQPLLSPQPQYGTDSSNSPSREKINIKHLEEVIGDKGELPQFTGKTIYFQFANEHTRIAVTTTDLFHKIIASQLDGT